MKLIHIETLYEKVESDTDLYGKFKLSPLAQGQGITIGNSLRRTLLSELKGIQIEGIKIYLNKMNNPKINEFSNIAGIKESILEILLNIKEIVIAKDSTTDLDSNHQGTEITSIKQYGKIEVQGPARITAKSLKLPKGLKLLNPTKYIATLNSNESLEIIFSIQQILNNNDSSQYLNQTPDEFETNEIKINYNSTPIKRVNYMFKLNKYK